MNHPERPQPSFMQQPAAAEDTAKNKDVQEDAGALQQPIGEAVDEERYSLSVDDVRVRLQEAGIQKSKDTIWRYCRDGRLDAMKRGIFQRFHITEESAANLLAELQLDAAADNGEQLNAAASEDSGQEISDLHEAAEGDAQLHESDDRQKEVEEPKLHTAADQLLEVKDKIIEDKDEEIKFLRDELKDRRGATQALDKMLTAFENNSQAQLQAAANEAEQLRRNQKPEPTEVEVMDNEGEGDNSQEDHETDGV